MYKFSCSHQGIHTPTYGHVVLGLTNRGDLTQTRLGTFHLFTHEKWLVQFPGLAPLDPHTRKTD
jgi:hypothetical protein